MRVGVFTALLAQFSLDKVLEKLKSLNIHTVELGTGNYPGDPHCKLSMLKERAALKEFKQKLDDNGFTISALSCHGNPLHPDKAVAKAYRGDQPARPSGWPKSWACPWSSISPAAPATATRRSIRTG